MDDRKAEPLRLLDICGIVNEQTLRSGPANAIESDLKNLRVRLHVTDAGDDHVVEQVEEIMSLAGVGKVSADQLLSPYRGYPACFSCFMISTVPGRDSRASLSNDRDTPGSGGHNAEIPLKGPRPLLRRGDLYLNEFHSMNLHFFQEAFHTLRIIREVTLVDVAGIPFEQDVAEVSLIALRCDDIYIILPPVPATGKAVQLCGRRLPLWLCIPRDVWDSAAGCSSHPVLIHSN